MVVWESWSWNQMKHETITPFLWMYRLLDRIVILVWTSEVGPHRKCEVMFVNVFIFVFCEYNILYILFDHWPIFLRFKYIWFLNFYPHPNPFPQISFKCCSLPPMLPAVLGRQRNWWTTLDFCKVSRITTRTDVSGKAVGWLDVVGIG